MTLKEIKTAIKDNAEKVEEVDEKVLTLREQFERQNDYMAIMEYKQKETFLRIRGLPEKDNENLLQRILPMLSQVWSLEEDDAVREIDRLYRVNSKIARDRRLPRDIIINCVRKSMRDEILRFHSTSRIQLEGKDMIILKEIPAVIRRKRKDYTQLVDTLRLNNISFRWNIPEGLFFQLDSRNYNINTVTKAQDFLTKNKKNLKYLDN
ncbi:uncharacterized protein LOC125433238 [Sphaerodactylus townsendi]|uniref:uncharacterized protein LOC125433238 n=1 Tax=Sphaerodactylus townsendi TaxID=933632 RepID=UPI0020269E1F|nr:uncharacterized protein LOC125433238 [Sphaerodactylus townsendi]